MAATTTTTDHAALLDQLHSQLNSVFEQTGRVFAALANNPKSHPTAQVTKLKHVLPTAAKSFHEALDQFQSELHVAQIVMRRDLAVCRERSGVQVAPQAAATSQPSPAPAKEEEAAPDSKVESPAAPEPDAKPIESIEPEPEASKPELPPDEDIIMEDSIPEDDEKPVPVMSFDELIAEDLPPKQPSPPLADSKPSVAAHTLPTADSIKAQNESLHLDTKPSPEEDKKDEAADEDKAPDTANDLDSLFNDPTSAGGAGGENQDFNFDQDGANDLDFGSFGGNYDANGGDNDNIASLLPGLEDYANTQPTNNDSNLDFNDIFGVGDAGNGMDSQGAGEHRDTFEDLMDLANFDGMDTGGGDSNTNNNTTNNTDFDFDSLFN